MLVVQRALSLRTMTLCFASLWAVERNERAPSRMDEYRMMLYLEAAQIHFSISRKYEVTSRCVACWDKSSHLLRRALPLPLSNTIVASLVFVLFG